MRRRWLTDPELVDLVAAANLIPGPTSTELAMHVGHRRAGRPGLLVAGLAFIVPSSVLVAGIAWAYVEYGARPESTAVLAAIAPAVLAVIVVATADLGRALLRDRFLVALAAAACLAVLLGAGEIPVLLAAGVIGLAARGRARAAALIGVPTLAGAGSGVAAAAGVGAPAIGGLFLAFVKIGAILVGSGYVLVALLRSELVDGLGWLTERQLLDALAAGQVTPGPLFTTATFVGWVLLGPAGALVATVAVFLPGFVYVLATVPVLDRLRGSAGARLVLDGVGAAAVGTIAAVAAELAPGAVGTPLDAVVAVVALLALAGRLVGPGTVILVAAAAGLVRALLNV